MSQSRSPKSTNVKPPKVKSAPSVRWFSADAGGRRSASAQSGLGPPSLIVSSMSSMLEEIMCTSTSPSDIRSPAAATIRASPATSR